MGIKEEEDLSFYNSAFFAIKIYKGISHKRIYGYQSARLGDQDGRVVFHYWKPCSLTSETIGNYSKCPWVTHETANCSR